MLKGVILTTIYLLSLSGFASGEETENVANSRYTITDSVAVAENSFLHMNKKDDFLLICHRSSQVFSVPANLTAQSYFRSAA